MLPYTVLLHRDAILKINLEVYEREISGDKLLHIILKTCQYPKITKAKKIALAVSN